MATMTEGYTQEQWDVLEMWWEMENIVRCHASVDHTGQKYGKVRYWWHLKAVQAKVEAIFYGKISELDLAIVMCLAWTHDTLEDCEDVTRKIMEARGYPEILIVSTEAITHLEGETRTEYLLRCMTDKYAHMGKIADTASNLEKSIEALNARRVTKYTNQMQILMENFSYEE